jgi:hypothetical protein
MEGIDGNPITLTKDVEVVHNGHRYNFEAGEHYMSPDLLEEVIKVHGPVEQEVKKTPEKPLILMNKADLMEKAKSLGIEVPEGSTNKEIVSLLSPK